MFLRQRKCHMIENSYMNEDFLLFSFVFSTNVENASKAKHRLIPLVEDD